MTTNTVFQLRRNSVSGTRPTTTTVAPGELAINTTDGILFSANSTAIFEIGANNTAIAVGNSTVRQTANSTGVYVNGSLAVTGNASVTGNLVIAATGELIISNGAGIQANGSFGTTGQTLTSNGTGVYWAAAGAGISSIISQQFTANGTANSFTVSGGYIPSAIEVYVAGVKQVPGTDVTITSGSTINFAVAPLNGQIVDVFGYVSTGSISSYLALTGGTLSGNLTFTNGSVIVANGSFGANGQLLTSNGTSMYWSSAGVNTAAQYAWTNTHTFAANVTFNTNTMFVDATNNRVGVGTTSPSTLLHLSSSGPAVLLIEADTDNVTETDNARILFRQDGGAVQGRLGYANNENIFEVTNEWADSLILGTSNTERMRITFDGNIGIGNSAPTEKLQVQGNIQLQNGASQANTVRNAGIRFWTDNAFGSELHWGDTASGLSSGWATAVYGRKADTVAVRIGAYPASNTSQNTFSEYVTVLNNGNVGIGALLPDARLTVTGAANVSGNVVIGGTATVSGNLTVAATSELIVANGAGIEANGSFGSAGQVLTSNSTGVYWAAAAAGVNTSAQYTWSNTHNFTNVVTFSTSNTIILPVGNTASRPAASNGMIRYNTNTGLIEAVANTTWTGLMAAYSSVREQFTASNNQTTFTVTGGYIAGQIDVYYNGVKLRSGSEVNVSSGSTIILAAGAANNALVEVVGIGPTFVVSNTAQIVYQQFTATNNQTTFTMSNGYVPGQVDVFADGIHLVNGVDVNVSSGSTVVLSAGVPNNTIVEVKGYSTPITSAQSSTAVRQTFTANSTVNNNFTVTGGYIPGQVDVFYNGAKLVNGSDVNTSSGTTIVLTSNAAANAIVDVVGINYFTAGGGVTTPVRQQFVATANQTTFTVTGGYTPGQIDVFRNGVKLTPGADVNISGGSTVVLVSPAANGDNIDVVGFAATSYQDSVRKSGDTISGSLAISSNLAVTGAATFSNTIAVTGTSTLTGNVTTAGVFTDAVATIRPLVQGTANTVSGANVDYTGIPSWVRRITIAFNGVSTNGSSVPQVQLGTSSGFATSGYLGAISAILSGNIPGCATIANGFSLADGGHAAAAVFHGTLTLCNVSGNNWTGMGILGRSDGVLRTYHVAGSIALSGVLDRIRLTTVNGTDAFDAGTINILYE